MYTITFQTQDNKGKKLQLSTIDAVVHGVRLLRANKAHHVSVYDPAGYLVYKRT